MLISQLLRQPVRPDLQVINQRCSNFIKESQQQPLYKSMPSHYQDVQKVKVRKRNIRDSFVETFNEAFSAEFDHLCQRAIYTYSTLDEQINDPFYVFPIDGYKYLYSTEVKSSSENYKHVFEMILNQFDNDTGREIITDLIKFSYTSTNLYEGIEKGSEIIFYGIPYYYAIRVSSVPQYSDLLTLISKSK